MWWFGKQSTARERVVLVTHVGSARVSIALAILKDDTKPRVVYHAETAIPFQKNLDIERFITLTVESFKESLTLVERKGFPHLSDRRVTIDHVYFVYGSPWYSAKTRVLVKKEEKPFVVTNTFVQSLVDSEVHTAEESVVEQHVTAVTLNGYPVHDLSTPRHTKHLRIAVSATAVPKNITDALQKELERRVHGATTTHHSFALAAFTAIRDIFHIVENFVIIDVGGEVTDVVFVKRGELLETASFPYGTRTLVRGVAKNTGHDSRSIPSLLGAYGERALEASHLETLASALNTEEHEWQRLFSGTISHFFHEIPLPGVVFFVVDHFIAPVFKTFIEHAHESGMFDAHQLQYVALRSHVDFPERVINDPFLAIDVYFAHRVVQ